jgi:hypothetical protein
MGSWGVASFENDAALDWFLLVEEAPDPGAVMAGAIVDVLSAAEHPELYVCCEAIAAAELCALCAGQTVATLADRIHTWAQANPHGPHAEEIALATQAVTRVQDESALRELWEDAGDYRRWSAELDESALATGQVKRRGATLAVSVTSSR